MVNNLNETSVFHSLGHNALSTDSGQISGGISGFVRKGLWISVEYLGNYEEQLSCFTEHLVSNVEAGIALGDVPPTRVLIIKSEGEESSREGLRVLTKYDTEEEYVEVNHQQLSEKIREALSLGSIVVSDRFISIFILQLLEEGKEVLVEDIYKGLPTYPDFTVFLQRESTELNVSAVAEQFLDLAALRPDFLRRLQLADNHKDTCDLLWLVCRGRIIEWGAQAV